jgi:glycopeptide antibiotics resistance protein
MALGLFTRKMWGHLPDWINSRLGDVIWAVMIYFMAGFLFHRSSVKKVALIAILFCYFIEVTQLYHATWIDNIRQTTLG